jgi:hypothetical protein
MSNFEPNGFREGNVSMEKDTKALLLETHSAIENSASVAIEAIKKEQYQISYPYGVSFTREEQKALAKLRADPNVLTALRKILLDSASYPVFHLLTLMDGVSGPQNYNEFWHGVKFCTRSEDDTEDLDLHDEFYATYDEWKKGSAE